MWMMALAAVTALGALSGTEGQGYDRAVRVVYFNPSDREPEPNYRDRLTVMTDIQGFYAQGNGRPVWAHDPPRTRRGGPTVIYRCSGPAGGSLRRPTDTSCAVRWLTWRDRVDADRHFIIFENLVVTEGDRLSGNTPYGGGDHRPALPG